MKLLKTQIENLATFLIDEQSDLRKSLEKDAAKSKEVIAEAKRYASIAKSLPKSNYQSREMQSVNYWIGFLKRNKVKVPYYKRYIAVQFLLFNVEKYETVSELLNQTRKDLKAYSKKRN